MNKSNVVFHFMLNNESITQSLTFQKTNTIEEMISIIWNCLDYNDPLIAQLENHHMVLFTQYKVKLNNSLKIQDLIDDGVLYNEDIIYITINLHSSTINKYIENFTNYLKYFCLYFNYTDEHPNSLYDFPNHNYLFYWNVNKLGMTC
tara:strand:+ start:1217 stop:1657 length:441 start_codon:yes stop_codon:yes gene_type:complete